MRSPRPCANWLRRETARDDRDPAPRCRAGPISEAPGAAHVGRRGRSLAAPRPRPAADQLSPGARRGGAAAHRRRDDGAVGLQRQRLPQHRRLLLLRQAPGDLPRRRPDRDGGHRPDPDLGAAHAGLVRHRVGRGLVDLDLHPAGHHRERQPELALFRLVVVLHPAGRVRQAGHDRLGGRRAGPQAAVARSAQAPADPVPAGQRVVDLAGAVPGRRRDGGGDGRDRRGHAVDRRRPVAGARRPGRRRHWPG